MMLKRLLATVAAVILFVLPGEGQDAKSPVEVRRTNPLYPIATGYKWHYRVTDLKAPDGAAKKPATVIITAGAERKFLITRKVKGQDVQEMIVGFDLHVAGAGTALNVVNEQVYVDEDGVYKVNGAGKAITPPLRFLKFGTKKGDSWTCDSESENISLRGEFVVDAETIRVPAGEFNATVVRARDFQIGSQKMQLTVWYAGNVGMVKHHVQSGNHNVILELEKVESK